MIVTCQECQTQFQLDDAKVPETGIRVRCSRCKCAFFVESPHRSDADHASQLARAALGDDPAREGRPARESGVSDEESDWQFNEDIAPDPAAEDSADDLAAARDAVDDLLGGASPPPAAAFGESTESGFDLLDDDGPDLPGTDLSSESEQECESEDDPNAVTLDRGTGSNSSEDPSAGSGLDLAEPSLAVPPQAEIETASDSAEAFGEVSKDLGSPAGWDFFEDSDAPASSGFAATRDSLGSTESDAGFGSEDLQALAASDDALEFEGDASRGDLWFTRLRGALGWTLVSGLCVYACAVVFFPELLAPAPDPAAMRVAGFEVVHVEGHWIENAVAGPIYVVSGALHNAGGTRPAPDSTLRIRLIDANGAAVISESAAVGPPISIQRLREANPRDLRSEQERAAPAVLHEPLERRKRRPFMAVLADIPAAAVAFEFEVATAPDPVTARADAPELDAGGAEALTLEGMAAEMSRARAVVPEATN